MTVLKAVPRDLYSWNYLVLEEKRELTRIDLDLLGEGGEFTIHGQAYSLAAPSLHSGAFVMQSGSRKLASSTRPSVFARGTSVQLGGRRYALVQEEIGARRYVLRQEGEPVGSIAPTGALSRKAIVDLPDEIGEAQKVFVLWLVLTAWRSAAEGRGM